MEMIAREFDRAMAESGVVVIDALGAEFDANLHEAVEKRPAEEKEGTILAQWRCGYKLGERLLRPASVVVSAGPDAEENNEGDKEDV